MAVTGQVAVYSNEQMESTINSYIASGFIVANRTPISATMMKKKEFSIVWAVVGFFLCVLPLFVYLIVYATQTDQVIVLTLMNGASPNPQFLQQPAGQIRYSPDGNYYWDGQAWQPVNYPDTSN